MPLVCDFRKCRRLPAPIVPYCSVDVDSSVYQYPYYLDVPVLNGN